MFIRKKSALVVVGLLLVAAAIGFDAGRTPRLLQDVRADDCGYERDGMSEAEKKAAEKQCEAEKDAAEDAKESSRKSEDREENDDKEERSTSTDSTSSNQTGSETVQEQAETATIVKAAKTEAVVTPVTVPPTYVTLTRYITIIDSGYDVDTDGDGLMDALDPDPAVPQKLYFTDTDGDTVPDVHDTYSGTDDFFVRPEGEEQNKNGILDWFEGL